MSDYSSPIYSSSFLNIDNASFISSLYDQYLNDPSSVDESWRSFFQSFSGKNSDVHDYLGKTKSAKEFFGSSNTKSIVEQNINSEGINVTNNANSHSDRSEVLDSIQAFKLVNAYRFLGHFKSNLDPLNIEKPSDFSGLDIENYGFSPDDIDKKIFVGGLWGYEYLTLSSIIEKLNSIYSGTIGVEFMHIEDTEERNWIQDKFESSDINFDTSADEKKKILSCLIRAEHFEKFLHIKYPSAKRFGLDGAESVIASLKYCLEESSLLGVNEAIFGMPHRGRLNVLTNILNKPYRAVFSEFQGKPAYPTDNIVHGTGDVKYHLGASADEVFSGKRVHLSLSPNPSHLEAVNPVVIGKVRAKQDLISDNNRRKVMGILLHGDAAFAGQGLVSETLSLSQLPGYKSGGTLHLIVNNQIGFTTSPDFSRSSAYCSDIAKMIQSPVFHVNGDDPEAVVRVSKYASEFRYKFNKDVVIDLYCYRRNGHNEMDEPAFTQPLMYNVIRSHDTTCSLYAKKLERDGVIKDDDFNVESKKFNLELQKEFDNAKDFNPEADWLGGFWEGFESNFNDLKSDYSISRDTLIDVGNSLNNIPGNFNLNTKLKRFISNRKKMLAGEMKLDWSMGEALAFGSLLYEGIPIRLSGQDSGRGTFTHRHSRFVDQKNGHSYIPLSNISDKQASFEVIDSPLAEASVLGFEYGYASTSPHSLVIWEAQFGDFANGAQVIIDQFITTGEMKWLRMNGLVLLLPHGYEGQGPEHSSARLERFLQLCGGDNIQVVNCTTPANYFHVIRRQVRRNLRKPLIIMTPKSLLRHKLAVSDLSDMDTGSCFLEVIPDNAFPVSNVRRVVLCSGKVYYDLLEARSKFNVDNVALIRVEQLYPFPSSMISKELSRYSNCEVIWCQEEPSNMGSWNFLDRKLEKILVDIGFSSRHISYVGRCEAASPSTGLFSQHVKEQDSIVKMALGVL